MFEFLVTQKFIKSLEKLDESNGREVKKKLHFLAKQENPLFFAKKIKGHKNIFRFRAGDYRIVFELYENQISLIATGHRKEIYKNL